MNVSMCVRCDGVDSTLWYIFLSSLLVPSALYGHVDRMNGERLRQFLHLSHNE